VDDVQKSETVTVAGLSAVAVSQDSTSSLVFERPKRYPQVHNDLGYQKEQGLYKDKK